MGVDDIVDDVRKALEVKDVEKFVLQKVLGFVEAIKVTLDDLIKFRRDVICRVWRQYEEIHPLVLFYVVIDELGNVLEDFLRGKPVWEHLNIHGDFVVRARDKAEELLEELCTGVKKAKK